MNEAITLLYLLVFLGSSHSVSVTGNQKLIDQPDLTGPDALQTQNWDRTNVPDDGKSIASNAIIAYLAQQRRKVGKESNFPTMVATNISEQCHNDSVAYHEAYLLRVDWAKRMYESTGKMPEALYYSGNLHGQGLFDECLSVQAYWTDTSFQGKYCTVFFDSALVMPWELEEETVHYEPKGTNWVGIWQVLEWLYDGPKLKEPKVRDTDRYSRYLSALDYCIPSSCSAEDFRWSIAQLIGGRAIDNTTYEGNSYYTSMVAVSDENYCYTKEKITATPSFDGPDIAVIVTLSLLGCIVLAATAHDLWLTYQNRPIQPKKASLSLQALHCFSMLTNGRKLLSTKSIVVDNLACLNGMRVLSTTWIVLYHSYYQAIINPMYNPLTFLKDALEWQLHGVLNATIAVDTFFLMSGLLVTYSLMRELDRNKGRFNIGLFYLHRFLRLTPVYAIILGFIATLLVYLGSGPNWENVRYLSLACRWNWWNNLLYVNNYVVTYPLECMGETWYLACDMQMFLLSPLFIYPLWRWRRIGLSWAIFNIVALLCGTIAIFIVWNLPAMGFFTRPTDTSNPYSYYGYYVQTWTRFPPYILGIMLGWLLHKTKNRTLKLNKGVVISGWFIASLIGLAVLYGMVPYLNEYEVPDMNDVARVSYGALHRFAWATSVAWIVFACIHGYGGLVNRFLSWKAFIPLARLTYVVYLVHFTYLTVYHGYIRKPYYYTKFTHAEHYFGVIFIVFLMAFAICLTAEVPLLNLEKLLIRPNRAKKSVVDDIEIEQPVPRIGMYYAKSTDGGL
ncbi:nose resistant to fluoxetine protein 6-like isoform X2 [Daphnia carinata]|uniref:nose resistant to fluoxetine protein 6-like isoform X2 n=1 Tax=Daphnia carinata TaxID=120202 RepID=UPI002868B559|nr:nose resistant to fluoxetine protein 6-like isoform X2 [Daphnia carinata]